MTSRTAYRLLCLLKLRFPASRRAYLEKNNFKVWKELNCIVDEYWLDAKGLKLFDSEYWYELNNARYLY